MNTFAHQGEDHSMQEKVEVEIDKNKFQLINESYQKNVFRIFESKCMDCHGDPKKMPWYHALPIVKKIMNDDMMEAKVHLDIREGFPFKGHGTPEEDLKAITKVIEKNEMPPLRYKVMHWSSGITKGEAKTIKSWVNQSIMRLNEDKH